MESLRAHRNLSRGEAQAIDALTRGGMPAPAGMMRRYPHKACGGQRQRVMIAMAILLKPRPLVADAPTTALDRAIQAQTQGLLRDLARESTMALLLITHDLGVVAQMAKQVVPIAGRAVETGLVGQVLDHSCHPSTRGLMAAQPTPETRGQGLTLIQSAPPRLGARPGGCAFHPRCALATAECQTVLPPEVALQDGQHAAGLHLEAALEPA